MANFSSNKDNFVNNLISRTSPEVAATFTEEQLNAIKKELDSSMGWSESFNHKLSRPLVKRHALSIPLVAHQRSLDYHLPTKQSKPLFWKIANTLVISTFVFLFITSAFGTLVLVKRKMKINLFPNIDFPDEAVEDFLCPAPRR
ncbi:hypothetical protein [Lyngbya aestuarii]|uniref:hypothetical protein n=1 Tax=Lyngbya aestuarii TaxID=118322 RepID=UPI00403DB937